jgi:glutamine synthetase
VGSSANCSNAMTTLNTIVAKQLKDFKIEVDALIESKDMKKDDAIFNVLREYTSKFLKYLLKEMVTAKWEVEAEKRG